MWHCTHNHKQEQEEVYFSIYCGDRCHSVVSACFMASALQADRKTYYYALGTCSCFSVFLCFVIKHAQDSLMFRNSCFGGRSMLSVYSHTFHTAVTISPEDSWSPALEILIPQPWSNAELVCGSLGELAVPCEAVTLAHRHI